MSDKELNFGSGTEEIPDDIFFDEDLFDEEDPAEEPVYEEAVPEEPVYEEPVTEEPVMEEPVMEDIVSEDALSDDDTFEFFSDDEFMSEDDLFTDAGEAPKPADTSADTTARAAAAAANAGAAAAAGSAVTSHEEDEESEEKGPSVVGRIISILIPAILVLVILVSGGLFLRDLLEYRAGEKVYDKLGEFITETPANSFVPDEEAPAVEVTGAVPEETVHAVYPRLAIDYDALKDANGDFVGVLYVPALDLKYPVAKSRDNNEYLSRTFEGTRNSAGSIFLDMNASIDLSDSNSIIFGHNMKNGTMFGSLQKFLQDETLVESDPYFYVYQDGRILKYRIFAYYTTLVDSAVYTGFQDAPGYGRYVAKAISSSAYKPAETFDFTGYPPMVVLSTCYGAGHVYNFVVHGVLQETIIRNH